jgi:beta-1,2-mannobiose phosphorylase / 1,2-beta-oligomannan phosphorylase
MWYTGQVWQAWNKGNSWIGYTSSKDGKNWTRYDGNPILSPELSWEDDGVICPNVIWDEQEKIYKMWYSAGDQFEPDAIGYATSKDGLYWKKYKNNPIFTCNKQCEWEQAKTTACQVIKRKNDYLMFYIGFKNPYYAQIGMARSKDGISNWERYKDNPIIRHGKGWDSEAVYKPFAIADSINNRWLLYFNARSSDHEQIGIAIHNGLDLGF